jgi:hypothetical protein
VLYPLSYVGGTSADVSAAWTVHHWLPETGYATDRSWQTNSPSGSMPMPMPTSPTSESQVSTMRPAPGDGWRTHSARSSAYSARPDHPGTRSSELMTSAPGAAARCLAKKLFRAPEWPSAATT